MQDMNVAEITKTAKDEMITSPCVNACGRDVTRKIPAGTSEPLARILRKFSVVCTDCAEREDSEAEARQQREIRERREANCELPVMLRGLTWDSYDTSRPGAAAVLAAAREWAAGTHRKRGLLVCGPVGVGKTRIGATATWEALDRLGVRYVNVAELIVRLSAAFADKDRQAALAVLTGRGPIVLDDLDKVNPTMTVLSHLYTAIDGRVQSGSSMLVTTNLDPGALVEKFARAKPGEDGAERRVAAEAIVDRLVGHCSVWEIGGGSGRR